MDIDLRQMANQLMMNKDKGQTSGKPNSNFMKASVAASSSHPSSKPNPHLSKKGAACCRPLFSPCYSDSCALVKKESVTSW